MPGIRPVSASSPPTLRSRARSATITMSATQAGLSTQQEELIRRIKAGETGLFLTALFCYRSGRGQKRAGVIVKALAPKPEVMVTSAL